MTQTAPADTGLIRSVSLPGRRRLLIRREGPDDAPDVMALYDRMPAEELYCRFFTARRPPDLFVERMTRVHERGGAALVAVLSGGRGRSVLVGEASYELLGNGDGELGIAVDRTARGWLGPFLLDAILEQAAARGVPNIEAEVLMSNRRMLAVLRARGFVVVEHFLSPATLRVAVATAAGGVPSWAGRRGQPRVLVEIPGGQWQRADAISRRGFQVLACPGPDRGGPPCGPLTGHRCPLAAGADVIVDAQPGDLGELLLAAHRRLHPDAALCATGPDAGSRVGAGRATAVLPTDDDETARLLAALAGTGQE